MTNISNKPANIAPKLLFLDTETTGVDMYRSGVHEIGGIIDIGGKIVDEFLITSDIFEDDEVSSSALEECKITLEQIHKYDPPEKAFKDLQAILGKYVDRFNKLDKFTVIGYFAEFDNKMLRRWWGRNGDKFFGSWFHHPWIDVASLAAYVYMDQRHLIPSFKLEELVKYLKIEMDGEQTHNGFYDSYLTRQVYYKITEG